MRDEFIGQIACFAIDALPPEWLPCDGRVLPIQGNQPLFAVIGNFYGGDARTNFALPDLRGRAPFGGHNGEKIDVAASGAKMEKLKTVALTYAICVNGAWPDRG